MTTISDAQILDAVRAVLPGVLAVTLFGSRAHGNATVASDLDLAVMLPGRADPVRLWEAGEAMARRLNVDVDLVDLLAASTVMQYQIITTGRRLYAADDQAERYELFILSEMMNLNEARAPLIAHIQREGRVYG